MVIVHWLISAVYSKLFLLRVKNSLIKPNMADT